MSATIHVLGLTEEETGALVHALQQGLTALLCSTEDAEPDPQTPQSFARFLRAHSGRLERLCEWLQHLPADAGFTLRGTHGVLYVSIHALESMGGAATPAAPRGGVLTQGETPHLLTHDQMQARMGWRRKERGQC